MKHFIFFLKNPSLEVAKPNFKTCFATYLFYQILVVGIFNFLALFIHYQFGLTIPHLKEEHNETFYSTFSAYNMLKITLLAPLIEEIGFRLPLDLSKKFIGLSLGIVTFSLLRLANRENVFALDYYVQIVISLMIVFLLSYFIMMTNLGDVVINSLTKNFRIYVYFMAIIFAVPHLLSFNYNELSPFSIFFILFPYCLFGMLQSFFRLSYGFSMCLLIHISHNSFTYILKILLNN